MLGYIASGNEVDLNKPNRPLLVVDVSRENTQGLFWNERIQGLVIKRLLDGVNTVAEAMFKENKSLNALVVIDEAHRLAPRALPEDDDTLIIDRNSLFDGVASRSPISFFILHVGQLNDVRFKPSMFYQVEICREVAI